MPSLPGPRAPANVNSGCPVCHDAGYLPNPFSTLADDLLRCPSCGADCARWATTDEPIHPLEGRPMRDCDCDDSLPVFRTSDGFTLWLDGKVWTDGDLIFPDKDGHPVDATGVPLEGNFVDPDDCRGCRCG